MPLRLIKVVVVMHAWIDLRAAIPAFARIRDGKLGDVDVLNILLGEIGAFYIRGRGCLNFSQLLNLTKVARSLTPARRAA